ncbi:hypothetical protein CLOM_g17155 [Closterium sp. NIES-68]|nr:hypothetical protein CLOM_g17155 [Closterium sp. NIES-68]
MRKDSKGRNWRLRLTVTTSRTVTEAAIESLCDSINRSWEHASQRRLHEGADKECERTRKVATGGCD